MSTDVPKSEEFYQLICRASRLLRRHALLIGGTLVALLAVGWLSAAVAVDLLIPLATTFRLLFAVGFWLVLVASVVGLLVWPALRRLTLEDVALRIERTVGGMHNRLLTVLDFHRTDAAGKKQSNPEMVARLMWQTRSKLAEFRIRQIVNPVPLLRSLVGLVAVLVLAVILAVIFRESAPTALARILRPTADIPPVTWLRIAAPGELTAPAGDPLTIGVDVTRGEVEDLSLHLQQPDGKWVVYPMQRDGEQRFSYTLSGVMADYRYKVSGGGTWTSEYQIRMVPRPTIDAVTASIRLPRYMQHTEPLPVADEVRRIEAPIDAHLMLAAAVSGDVDRGEVVLLKRSVEIHDEVQDEEHVWFEDDLPADAETVAPWRWSTARTFTGLKSFTFDRSHQPFGFITRLSPLHVPAPGLFYLMVWLDAADPPGRITLRLRQDNLTRAFDWGEKSTPAAGQPPAVHLGSLPQPTRWGRLEVPADVLGAVPNGVKLLGMSLEIDRGQAFFDRPGYLIRSSRPVETVHMETVDTLPMQRDEASGRWLGDVPVAVDRLLTVRFHSALGQASADREPLELIATKDQPPSIVVEKPGLDVVLPAVQPLPISARALDDWGIAAIGIQLGQAENAMSAVRWQPGDAALVTARNINLAIDSQAEHLAPNQTLCYRLVAKDCNGQTTESKIFKLAIAAPDRAGVPETAKAPESLEQLLKMVAQMAQAPRKDRESAEFVAGLPAALRGLVDSQGVFRKNDGSLLPAEELRKLIEQAESQLTPDQKKRLAELTAELDRRQQELKQLAEMLKQAAQKSAASPLALQQDSKLLTRFATQTQAMAADLNPTTVTQGPAAPLERELKADKLAADQSQRLADLEQQLRQLDAARQQMTADPQLAGQMLDDQTAGVEGLAAARELEALATDLDARGRQLQAIEEQTAEMAEQSPTAASNQLDAISQSQAELDEKALTVIDQLKDLLGLKPEDDEEPLAPWVPPGEKFESTPVEEDVPDAKKKDKDKADKNEDDANGKDKEASKPDEDENWWDKPADMPAVGGPRGEESERYKDRHRPVPEEVADEESGAAGGKPKPPEPTPRQQLTAHQAQMQQALTENADEARRQGAAARDMAQRLAAKASQSAADAAGDKSRVAATRETLADPATQQALKTAQRMRAGLSAPKSASRGPRPGQGKSPPQAARPGGGSSTGTVSVQPGSIVPGPAPLGSDPRERAQFYQLPPRLREPLLEGMQERGPEGYQPLIDAYFRELSKEIK